jgi:guanylate kinase
MDTIVCLVGESGSGKSTIAEELEKEGYNYIQSYTTRPKRYDNEKGHIFVKDVPTSIHVHGFSNEAIIKNGIMAHTFFDGYYYWASKEQYQNKGISIYVIDPKGVEKLKESINDAEIVVLYIKADEATRWKRMLRRELEVNECDELGFIQRIEMHNLMREKVEKRIRHDQEAFKIIKCDYVVDANQPIDEVVRLVKQITGGSA